MGKRVIISEGQYGRIFLNEQKLPKANAGEIQQFLIDNGALPPYRIVKGKKYSNKDWDFGDGTAKAFAKYYGLTNIKTVKQLHNKLNSDGYNVGNRVGFGTDMAQVLSDLIKKREGELPDLNKRFFYSEDGKSGISSVLSDSQIYKYWGTNNDWKYWVKRNGGMSKHLQGLRKSYNGASDKPGYIKVLMVSEYGIDWIYNGKIISNNGGTPIFWAYELKEEREKEKKEEEEKAKIDVYNKKKKEIELTYQKRLQWDTKTKSYITKNIDTPEKFDIENKTDLGNKSPLYNSNTIRFDDGVGEDIFSHNNSSKNIWKYNLGSKNNNTNVVDFNKYVSDYNKTKSKWSISNIDFNWGNRSVVVVNNSFIKHHPMLEKLGKDSKSNFEFSTLNDYLSINKTQLLSPEWIINEIWELKTYNKTSPEFYMRKLYFESLKKEAGLNPKLSYSLLPIEIKKKIRDYRKNHPTDVESGMIGYIQLLDFIKEWNDKFNTQKSSDIKLCDDVVFSTGVVGALFSGPANFRHETWKSFCKKGVGRGGNWIYDVDSVDKWGNKNYIRGCGCVNTPDYDFSNITSNPFSTYSVNPAVQISRTMHDNRDFKYKAQEFAEECTSDWHCWANIVAIAALFFACPFTGGATCAISGAMLAGAIEVGSGIGYMWEQKDGWKVNAGLEFLSIITLGSSRIFKLSKSLKVGKYNKMYSGIIDRSMKGYTSDMWKGLSKLERDKLVGESFEQSFKGMSSSEIRKVIDLNDSVMEIATSKEMKSFMSQVEGLSSSSKVDFNNMLKAAEKNPKVLKYIESSFKSGVDIKKIIKNYTKYVPSKTLVGIQSSLFATMYIYNEETANAIRKGIISFEELTGIGLQKMMGMSTDIDPNDSESVNLQKKLKEFEGYSTLLTEINNYIKNTIYTYLIKYDIPPSKNMEDVLVNGYDSIIGNPLENVLERLETIVEIIQRMEEENKTESEIKEKLEYLYNEEIKYLELEGKKDNIIKDIRDANKANPITDENKKWMEENGIDIDTEVWDMNLLEIE